jgi:hypothetical protein
VFLFTVTLVVNPASNPLDTLVDAFSDTNIPLPSIPVTLLLTAVFQLEKVDILL